MNTTHHHTSASRHLIRKVHLAAASAIVAAVFLIGGVSCAKRIITPASIHFGAATAPGTGAATPSNPDGTPTPLPDVKFPPGCSWAHPPAWWMYPAEDGELWV